MSDVKYFAIHTHETNNKFIPFENRIITFWNSTIKVVQIWTNVDM